MTVPLMVLSDSNVIIGIGSRPSLVVPSGATNLKFVISGGSGDADLYVQLNAAPTTSSYLCRPYLSGNSETCTFASPTAGTYHVRINAYSTFSGVTLTPSYTP